MMRIASNPEQRLRFAGYSAHAAGLAALAAVFALSYVAFIQPQHAAWRTARQERMELESLVRRAPVIKRTFAALTQQQGEFDERVRAAALRIPTEPQEAEFLAQIQSFTRASAVVLKDYRPGVVVTGAPVSHMENGLAVSGPYAKVCRLLEQLGKLERFTRVVRFEVKQASGPDECQVNLTLWIYFDAAQTSVRSNHA
jgi:Tfp pilus assembly protein PilO